MDSDAFRKKLLEQKKKRATEIAYLVCKKEKLPIPKINFNGCPEETQNQLAHYHFPPEHKICISTTQLYKLKTIRSVENVMFHELAHIKEHKHGGKHRKTKNKYQLEAWTPPPGVVFVSGKKVLAKSAKIRKEEEAKLQQQLKNQYDTTLALNKSSTCTKHACKYKAVGSCNYCGERFCDQHLQALIMATDAQWYAISKDDVQKKMKYDSDDEKGAKGIGHRCLKYKAAWDRWYGLKTQREHEALESFVSGDTPYRQIPNEPSPILASGMSRTEIEKARAKLGIEIEKPISRTKSASTNERIPSYHETKDLEFVRNKLGIDPDDKSHIKQKKEKMPKEPEKKKGLLDRLKEMFGL